MRITDANEESLEELFCSVDDKIIRILISIPRSVIYKIYYTLAKYAKSSKTSPITRIFSEKNNNQTLILRRFYNGKIHQLKDQSFFYRLKGEEGGGVFFWRGSHGFQGKRRGVSLCQIIH